MTKKLFALLLSFTLTSNAFSAVWDMSESEFDFTEASKELYSPLDPTTENLEDFEVTKKEDDCSVISKEEHASILLIPDEISKTSYDLDLQDENIQNLKKLGGKWAYEFMWVPKKGDAKILDAFNEDIGMIPASIVKLFTGWMAFDQKTQKTTVLEHMLQHSDNDQAKQALTSVGGIEKMKEHYAMLNWFGVFSPVDGSGYCVANKASASVFNVHLKTIRDSEKYKGFKNLLAQPLGPGTLKRRLEGLSGKLFAKTGTMGESGIISLAGFYESPKGTLIFTIIVNSMKDKKKTTRSHVDALLVRHVLYVQHNL